MPIAQSTVIHTNGIEPKMSSEDKFDAVYTHFRQKDERGWRIRCLSCDEDFSYTNFIDISDHFAAVEHRKAYSYCLYCKGKVHLYKMTLGNERKLKFYHDCYNSKRKIDK